MNSFGDTWTFHVAPSSDQMFNLSNTLINDQIPEKNPDSAKSALTVLTANLQLAC